MNRTFLFYHMYTDLSIGGFFGLLATSVKPADKAHTKARTSRGCDVGFGNAESKKNRWHGKPTRRDNRPRRTS